MSLKLLIRYLTDECSKNEKEFVEHWIQADLKNKDFIESLKEVWNVEPNDEITVNAELAWKNLKSDIIDEHKYTSRYFKLPISNFKQLNSGYIYTYLAVAAAIFLVASLLLIDIHVSSEVPDKEQFTMQEIITGKGEKSRIKLSDGTSVILNSESRIQIPSQFVGDSRELYLSGEAYFEVTKKDDKPFIVYSGHSYVRVLGTKFVVSAYPIDEKVVVAVTEGKVQIDVRQALKGDDKSEGFIAEEGDLGVLYKDKKPVITRQENIHEYASWTEGKLIFKNAPLKEIKHRIERWYDIKVSIDDTTLYNRELTTVFDNEPINEVLKIISLSMDMEYIKEKRQVSFFD